MYEAYELNVMAPLRLMRHFAPGMAERGWGRIVNVTSTAGKRPSQSYPAYSIAKAAQHSLSRAAADFWAPRGVLVNTVAPGADRDRAVARGGRSRRPARAAPRDRRSARSVESPGREGPAPPDRRARGGRRRDRLPLLGARRLGHRRRLVGRRRRLAVDALGRADDRVAELHDGRRGRWRSWGCRPRTRSCRAVGRPHVVGQRVGPGRGRRRPRRGRPRCRPRPRRWTRGPGRTPASAPAAKRTSSVPLKRATSRARRPPSMISPPSIDWSAISDAPTPLLRISAWPTALSSSSSVPTALARGPRRQAVADGR